MTDPVVQPNIKVVINRSDKAYKEPTIQKQNENSVIPQISIILSKPVKNQKLSEKPSSKKYVGVIYPEEDYARVLIELDRVDKWRKKQRESFPTKNGKHKAVIKPIATPKTIRISMDDGPMIISVSKLKQTNSVFTMEDKPVATFPLWA